MNSPTFNAPSIRSARFLNQSIPYEFIVTNNHIISPTNRLVKNNTIAAVMYLISGALPNAPKTNPPTIAPIRIYFNPGVGFVPVGTLELLHTAEFLKSGKLISPFESIY